MSTQDIALTVQDLKVHFGGKKNVLGGKSNTVHAVDGVSFEVPAGTTFGIVGESGSGAHPARSIPARLAAVSRRRQLRYCNKTECLSVVNWGVQRCLQYHQGRSSWPWLPRAYRAVRFPSP